MRFNCLHFPPELGARVACDLCGDVTGTPGAAGALLTQALRVGTGEALLLSPTGDSLIRRLWRFHFTFSVSSITQIRPLKVKCKKKFKNFYCGKEQVYFKVGTEGGE